MVWKWLKELVGQLPEAVGKEQWADVADVVKLLQGRMVRVKRLCGCSQCWKQYCCARTRRRSIGFTSRQGYFYGKLQLAPLLSDRCYNPIKKGATR